jgi:tape measure domain-containing protein
MADSTRRVSVRLSLDDGARVKQELREVGETGQRSLERIQAGAERASDGLRVLDTAVRAVQLVALGAGLRAFVQAGDALTQSFFRLQNATGSVAAAGAVYEQLYLSARQTGVAVSESADAFQRFSVAARSIGATNEEVARLVGGLQRSAVVSGASAQEVGSATLQLAQGLASGVLQGDELRSLLESMPLLAEALANQLGVGVGQLRRMGSEGKLTADIVFPALLRATEDLSKQLENAPLTVARAFGQLSVSTNNFLGQLDQAIGLSNTLARVLSGAANALDGVRRGAGLTSPSESLAAQRRQLEGLDSQIATLESGGGSSARRGSLRPGLIGTAEDQAGVGRNARLEELRRERLRIIEQIDTAERDGLIRNLDEREQAERRASEARRARGEQDIAQLRPQLDARFRITQEFEERTRRLNDAAASGAIQAADRDRLAALATKDRDDALRALEGTTQRVGRAAREDTAAQREAERALNDLIRQREGLIRSVENPQEKRDRRLSEVAELATRAEAAGRAIDPETLLRSGEQITAEYDAAISRVRTNARETSDVARQLGLTFSSAFEDAVVKGKSFSDVLQGIGADLLRLGTRKLVTEPLAAAASGLFNSATGADGILGANSAIGGLFSGGGLIGRLLAGVFHEGGLVGAGGPTRGLPIHAFLGAPRYHNGGMAGLAPDEVPAILQRGERVLSRDQVRRGMGGGASIVMNIQTSDAGSFQASQNQILAGLHRSLARGQRGV